MLKVEAFITGLDFLLATLTGGVGLFLLDTALFFAVKI